jgi:glycosyltransferase involved in cell wall biosynthesis
MLTSHHYFFKDRVRSLMHFGEGVVLARRMERDGITHIHSHYASQPTSVARVVHLLTGIPYSFSAHAHDIWHDRLQVREKLRETRFVACCSRCGQVELTRQGDPRDAAKVRVVFHGIDIRRFVPPEPALRRPGRILAVGRFESVKGYPNLIRACEILRREGVDFHCCIIGTGDEYDLVTEMVRARGLADRVSLPGAMPQERLLPYYHESTIFTLPCIPADDGRHDGIPNVIAEAMATGLPVVSTTIGGIPELVREGVEGFLVTPGSVDELAAALLRLLRDQPLRERMGAAARARVCADFDNQRCIEPLIELFQSECGLKAQSA